MKVYTNNKPRNILGWHDLTEKEQLDFDYLNTEERQLDAEFFRYKGCVYDMGDFDGFCGSIAESFNTVGNQTKDAWDGYQSDSFFSGVLMRYKNDFKQVVVGIYIS